MHTPIIALLLTLTSEPSASATPSQSADPISSPDARFDVTTAEVETWDSSSHLITYDGEGEVSASLVIWSDSSGQLRFDANFADGVHLSAVRVGDDIQIESDDPTEVAARVAAIDDYLAGTGEQMPVGWLSCAAKTAATAYYCATVNPVLCLSGTVLAACDCVPLILGHGECF
jgi:hypothetical protein